LNPNNYTTTYEVPKEYVGKSLSQIRNDTNGSFRPDVLASQLGIGENDALKDGQYFQISSLDPAYQGNSGEAQALRNIFKAGPSAEQRAVQPYIDTLQASKKPIEERYKTLIDSIKGNQQTATNRQTVATANELGRRGITGDGLYDQTFTDALNPITREYTNMLSNANTQQSADLNQVDQLIAQIQSGASKDAIQNAFNVMQLQQQAKQNADNLALQRDQLAQNKVESAADREFRLQQASKTDPFANLLNVGGKLYNASTGQWITPPSTASANSGWD